MSQELREGIMQKSKRELMMQKIPVDKFIEKYRVDNPFVIETLKEFPVLSYLLGSVSEKTFENNRTVTEGSGMFGLSNS
ncbi:MAG: hypothetical protein AAB492_00550 [Patescibacteria group bacterium]